ncbi:MAG TPA: hypothetical protein PKD64_03015 [Pirellulaceae bacterium]|nr:hypothetical protein [Pirellulaceae bacterium]HMO91140.1 hypothetical protein [Pirellulaceae bacterium]HMP69089.1 hypothetical protein [Pirellulaceae bacterium]
MSDQRKASNKFPAPYLQLQPNTCGHFATLSDVERLERQIVRLRVTLTCIIIIAAAVIGVGAIRPVTITDVIRTERLEIVEPDGSLAFVLANSARPQVATLDGVPILSGQEEERRNPSFVFFDGHGDEVGGMLFRNDVSADGFSATRHFSLDGFQQDQTVVLHHYQDARGTRAGLSVTERPEQSLVKGFESLGLQLPVDRSQLQEAIMALPEAERQTRLTEIFGGAPRAFVGRALDGSAALVLSDGQGRPRIMLGVPLEGDPFLRILDEDGTPIVNLPSSE